MREQLIDERLLGAGKVEVRNAFGLLSQRERAILQLVVDGKSSKDIAGILFLSPKTIETYRSRVMRKLGLRNVPNLVRFTIQSGLALLR